MEDGQLAGQRAGHYIRRHRSNKRRTDKGRGKMPLELFQDKNQAGQGRIKGSGQAATRPGSNQGLPFARVRPEPVGDCGPHSATHLDGGTFPAECQPAANADHSTQEFYRHNGLPPHGAEPIENRF